MPKNYRENFQKKNQNIESQQFLNLLNNNQTTQRSSMSPLKNKLRVLYFKQTAQANQSQLLEFTSQYFQQGLENMPAQTFSRSKDLSIEKVNQINQTA